MDMEALFCRFRAAVRGVVLVLILVGILAMGLLPPGVAWATSQTDTSLGTIAQFIPRQALVTLSLAKPVQDIPGPLGGPLEQILRDQWQRLGIGEFRRLQDWADHEMAIALLPPVQEPLPSQALNIGDRLLWIIKIRRNDAASDFLDHLWRDRQGNGGRSETYQGVRLISSAADSRPANAKSEPDGLPVATAQVKDQVMLIAANPQLIKAALASAQSPDASLGRMASYRQAIATLPPNSWGFIYGNLQSWGDPSQLSPRYDRIFLALHPDPTHLRLDLALKGMTESPDGETEANLTTGSGIDLGVIQTWPADPGMALIGQALPQAWQDINAALTTYPTARATSGESILERAIADLGQQWKIDLVKTLFPLGSQAYALGLWPQAADSNQLDWLWTSPITPETDTVLATLDNIATDQGFSRDPIAVGGQSVQAWTKLSPDFENTGRLVSQVGGVYGQNGETVWLGSSLVTLSEYFQNLGQPGMAKSNGSSSWLKLNQWGFKGQDIQGLLYLNWSKSRFLLGHRIPFLRIIDAWTMPLGEQLQSITLINQGRHGQFQRATAIIEINRTGKQ